MGIQTLVAAQSDGWMRSTLQHLRRMTGLRLRLVVVLQATTKEQQREEIDNLVRLATIKLNGKILGLGVEVPLALAVEMAVVTTVATGAGRRAAGRGRAELASLVSGSLVLSWVLGSSLVCL